jgi:hypothetical protein
MPKASGKDQHIHIESGILSIALSALRASVLPTSPTAEKEIY